VAKTIGSPSKTDTLLGHLNMFKKWLRTL